MDTLAAVPLSQNSQEPYCFTAQNKMTVAVPGTLPEETEVELSEFLPMADGV